MAGEQKYISWLTLVLSGVAGFCDTATFVAGDNIFSAHVTGNFIVFAAQVVFGRDELAWIKLITFPVFVTAIITGGWLAEKKASNRYFILLVEGVLLVICGGGAFFSHYYYQQMDLTYWIVMMVVVAMGLQNAFGKLFAKETHGPTTMMTGNVTQASLDLGNVLRKGISTESSSALKKQLFLIGGFLLGCLLGALFSSKYGLDSVFLPGVAILVSYSILLKTSRAVNDLSN
jgi:uncharacterized membrane protein YoaK (UPF0700 family)